MRKKIAVLVTNSSALRSLVNTGKTCPVAKSVNRSQCLCCLEDVAVFVNASRANCWPGIVVGSR